MKTMTSEECINEFSQQSIEKQNAAILVLRELKKAESKHPEWPTAPNKVNDRKDYIIAAAIVSEESGELIREALQFTYETPGIDAEGKYNDLIKEATQTAAMGMRFIINS